MTPDKAVETLTGEANRLEFKAANLRERGEPVMARQEEVVAEALRVLIAEREFSLRDPAHENCRNAEQQLERQRDMAEARVKELEAEAALRETLIDAGGVVANAKATERAIKAEQENERLLAALEDERILMRRLLAKLEPRTVRNYNAIVNSYAAAEIPDWEILQRLEAIDAALAQPEAEPKEEHRKHPSGDYCVFCLSQWPCAEAPKEER